LFILDTQRQVLHPYNTLSVLFLHIRNLLQRCTGGQNWVITGSNLGCHYHPFYYPQTCQIEKRPAHHELFQAGAFHDASRWQRGQDKQMCETLFREIESANENLVILSSESGLPALGRRPRVDPSHQINFFERRQKNFDLKVAYYVRNQFELLESDFYTHCRMHKVHPEEQSFGNFFANRAHVFNFWENVESFWERLIGKRNILTKVYHRSNLHYNDIVHDFLALINMENNNFPEHYLPNSELNKTPEYEGK
jgi:hypothetical protein